MPPSYARGTTASTSKSTPRSQKSYKTTPSHHPTFPIRPLDPTKPCPISRLPTELRAAIYSHVLAPTVYISHPRIGGKPNRTIWPPLLSVSRTVRNEAAYVFYTQSAFVGTARRLDFGGVMAWVRSLPAAHRGFLGRNGGLVVEVEEGGWGQRPVWQSRGGGAKKRDWSVCARFGNVYVLREEDRLRFRAFCMLAEWWLWCAKAENRGLRWRYDFDHQNNQQSIFMFELDSVAMPCVQKAWTRKGTQGGRMKGPALDMLAQLDGSWHKAEDLRGSRAIEEERGIWEKKVRAVRKILEEL